MSIAKNDYVILPNMSSFDDVTSEIDYHDNSLVGNEIAKVTYYFEDMAIGSTKILLSADAVKSYDFEPITTKDGIVSGRPDNVIFINIRLLLITVLILAGICILILVIHSLFYDKRLTKAERRNRTRYKKAERRRKRERRRERSFEKKRARRARRRR